MSSLKVEIHPYTMADIDDLYAAARESIAEVSPRMQWCHADDSIDESREFVVRSIERFDDSLVTSFA